MDTISRESNTSYAPIAALIVGLLALVLSIVGLVKVSALNKKLAAVDDLEARVQTIQTDVRSAVSASEGAARNVNNLATQTQRAFDTVTSELGTLRTQVNKLELAGARPAAASSSSSGGSSGPATAAPGDGYVVKAGDTGVKIARALGVTLGDLQSVNPDVDWNRLKVGQKINVPKR